MRVTNLEWNEENIFHISRHNVSPEEISEVCFMRAPKIEKGRENLYYITGQTESGRHLFIVIKYINRGKAKVITARDMDRREKNRYKRRK